jgi:hypothetical protein
MTDAQKDAPKVRRTRLQKRGLRRVEVMVRLEDVELLRDVAAALREDGEHARWMRNALRDAAKQPAEQTVAEVLGSSPDISGPDFDAAPEDIDHSRQQPAAAKVRDGNS